MLALPLSQRSERPTTFITEMRNAQRYSVSSKSAYQVQQSKTLSMLPKLVTKKPTIHLEEVDQCKLDHIYELLAAEIIALKAEIMPIRNQYLRLKDHLLFQNRCAANSKVVFSEQVPELSAAIGEGTFSSIINQFQEQSDLNTEEMVELHQKLSSYSVIKLACEVDTAREELIQMKKNIQQMKDQTEDLQARIADIKESNIQIEVQQQKDRIRQLIVDVTRAESKNVKLIKLEDQLSREVPEIAPENQEAFDEIQKLSLQLTEKRQIYFQKCNELIEVRNKQMREISNLQRSKQSQKQARFQIAEPSSQPSRARKVPMQTNENVGNVITIDENEIEEIPVDIDQYKSEKEWIHVDE
ncbi:hypothetical protein TRFO_02213 [Tritrichomonas foetus]|uniref:Uncharacterized protein n=1 Tax=Tritrichomonas foetus TaxID=1144522 RepID=A0A1J4JD82_9EUKA|nr:hypothetical protein TRFO_02213 [Tritrichomonas foetus]|eukprot:OHS95236.1 hypothetical protein TRFO_02213 [Tritrichomonas foetus]